MNTILITLLIIAVLILAHEWGHFVVARRIGIPVYEFAIGFGPKVFSWKRNGVIYSLRLIPLGGFVRMAGEEPDFFQSSAGCTIGRITSCPPARSISSRTIFIIFLRTRLAKGK
jgi:RIP metalloprotease RseP